MARFGSDIGPFAVVPLRLITASVSDRAVRLFALLAAKYADKDGRAFPSRRTLSDDLNVSMDTIDRAIAELTDAGALTSERRHGKAGDYTSNLYLLRFMLPEDTADGSRTVAATGTDTATVAAPTPRPSRTAAATLAAPLLQQEPNPCETDSLTQKEHALARFSLFWDAYPSSHRKGRGAAEKAWAKLKPSAELTTTIVRAVERHIQHEPKWRPNRQGETFIPHPATFLNQKRWLDTVAGHIAHTAQEPAGATNAPGPIIRATEAQIDAVLATADLRARVEADVDAQLAPWKNRLGVEAYNAARLRGLREVGARYIHHLTAAEQEWVTPEPSADLSLGDDDDDQ